jgi:hypothetical protein
MSMAERRRHSREFKGRKGIESRAHSHAHKHDGHKMAVLVNHLFIERNHGSDSGKQPTRGLASS